MHGHFIHYPKRNLIQKPLKQDGLLDLKKILNRPHLQGHLLFILIWNHHVAYIWLCMRLVYPYQWGGYDGYIAFVHLYSSFTLIACTTLLFNNNPIYKIFSGSRGIASWPHWLHCSTDIYFINPEKLKGNLNTRYKDGQNVHKHSVLFASLPPYRFLHRIWLLIKPTITWLVLNWS